jgi:hypothetical protein
MTYINPDTFTHYRSSTQTLLGSQSPCTLRLCASHSDLSDSTLRSLRLIFFVLFAVHLFVVNLHSNRLSPTRLRACACGDK